ncbi:DNA-3-methyladenine glycosylase I [Mycobacterium spongiae]|uniref:DNA-3-methyladenine glycosylase I n=1 Tax=Mycobacterium spongiae TaxID=886343 RepID=A0A975K051_9MYCO|nr:DNA-3-methyladenine glycosylase I [Mycobacterium spongiae]QUR68927.1 hypothetical protein F6B93_19260 [Mycobacterium spongiae]
MALHEAPEQISVGGVDDYLAAMSRMVFQSGMGRSVVDAKWADISDAFDHFDCASVAAYNPTDVDRLCNDARVIRNRRKIEAIIANANTLLDLDADPGFGVWLKSHPSDADRVTALRKQFKFLGPTGIHEFLWIVGETSDPGCGS